MIGNQDKSILKQLVQSPQWSVIEHLANEVCVKLEGESSVHDSEWETLKATLLKEGKVRGIRHLLQEIYNYAGN